MASDAPIRICDAGRIKPPVIFLKIEFSKASAKRDFPFFGNINEQENKKDMAPLSVTWLGSAILEKEE